MSVESRIRALDRVRAADHRRWVHSYREAVGAADRGTATIRQYRLVDGHEVQRWRDECAHSAVLFVARARLGTGELNWRDVAGYPPDAPLPAALEAAISGLQRDATADNEWIRELRFVDLRSVANGRFTAAVVMLVLGDLHGVRLRRHLWRIQGTRWVLSQRARDAGQREGLSTVKEADEFLGLGDRVTQAVLAGDIAELAGGGISYAELGRAVQRLGWATQHRPTWSDQVRSGQELSQHVCKDLQSGVHRMDCTEKAGR